MQHAKRPSRGTVMTAYTMAKARQRKRDRLEFAVMAALWIAGTALVAWLESRRKDR